MGARGRAVPDGVAAGTATPSGRAAVPGDGRGSAGNPGGTAVGACGGAGPPGDGRHDPGRPRVSEPRADQCRRRRHGRRRRPLRQLARRRRVHVRPQRGAGGRAQHLGLRAGVPADYLGLAAQRPAPAGGDGQAVLRRRAGLRAAAGRGRPGGLPGAAGAVRASVVGGGTRRRRGGLRAGRVGRPPRAGTSGSGWRITPGPGEPSNLDLLRAAVAVVEGLGRAPATAAQARRILGVPFSPRRV
jgi:hypothetical protein